jgi:glycosyltransferase involved in cell wall biosynthesis
LPVTLARALRRPVIVTGTFDFWMFDRRPRVVRALHRFALRAASANVFVSQLELDAVSNALKTNNPFYIPHGVDVRRLVPLTSTREQFILTIAGSGMDQGNSERKCIAEIIRAAPLIHRVNPDVRFVIVGKKGSDYPALYALARDVGADSYIDFPGIISEDEKIKLLQLCRVYLQPSRYEGFGLSILEAMSCGAPVVTSAAGAVPEVGGDAVAYSPDVAPEAIASTVNALLSDVDAQRRLSIKARDRAARYFSIERRAADLEKVVTSVMRSRL